MVMAARMAAAMAVRRASIAPSSLTPLAPALRLHTTAAPRTGAGTSGSPSSAEAAASATVLPLKMEVAVPPQSAAGTAAKSAELAPVLCLHGLFGSRSNMRTQARTLAERTGRHVAIVDMRNHGDSPHSHVMTYPAMAADVLAAAEKLSALAGTPAGGRTVLLGHSMGGKAAMTAALLRPDRVASLVVVDIAPVPYGAMRMTHSVAEAMRRVPLDTARTREEADTVLRQHLADDTIRRFVMTNFLPAREGDAAAAWRVNLDVVTRCMPTLADFPEDLLPPPTGTGKAFRDPALFIHGSRSDYVLPQHHESITRAFPSAQLQALPTHHWVHAENPAAFVRAVVGFLAGKA